MDGPSQNGESQAGKSQQLTLGLDDYAWRAITRESSKLGVLTEDLVRFSLLYYLADIDSQRVARGLHGAHAIQTALENSSSDPCEDRLPAPIPIRRKLAPDAPA